MLKFGRQNGDVLIENDAVVDGVRHVYLRVGGHFLHLSDFGDSLGIGADTGAMRIWPNGVSVTSGGIGVFADVVVVREGVVEVHPTRTDEKGGVHSLRLMWQKSDNQATNPTQ